MQALRQAESGTTDVDICRKLGVIETTFYRWKTQYTGPEVSDLRELKQLRSIQGGECFLTLVPSNSVVRQPS